MSLNQEEKDGLENLFQNKFKNWEVPPPPDAWANIKGQINQPKTAFLAWKSVLPLLALLMIVGGGYWYTTDEFQQVSLANPHPNQPTSQPKATDQLANEVLTKQPQSITATVENPSQVATTQVLTQGPSSTNASKHSGNSVDSPEGKQAKSTELNAESHLLSHVGATSPMVKEHASITVRPGTTMPYRQTNRSVMGAEINPNQIVAQRVSGLAEDQDPSPATETTSTNKASSLTPNQMPGSDSPLAKSAILTAKVAATAANGIRDHSGISEDQTKGKAIGTSGPSNAPNSSDQDQTRRQDQQSEASLTNIQIQSKATSGLQNQVEINDLSIDAKLEANRKDEIRPLVDQLSANNAPNHNPVIVAGTRGKAELGLTKWSVDAYIMPRFSFRRVEAGLENEMQVRSLENQNRFSADRIGYEAGARLVRTISNRFELNVGLHFASINEELVYKVDHSTPVGLTQSTNQDGSMMLTPVFASGTVQQKSSFYYGGLNLGTSLYLANTDRIRLSGGLGANWLMRGYTARVHNGVPMADFAFPEANEPFQQINMHLYTGIAYIQPVSDRISVMVEPTLNFFLFSTYAKREPISVTPTTLGLNLMLRYKL